METGIHELTAGYALDALAPDERRAYEEHLEACARCQEELESFWQTTESLAVAASGAAPSPALRERILAGARPEAQNVIPLEPRRRRIAPALSAVAAVAAVVALGIGLWATQLSGELDETRSALERERRAAEVLAHPSARTVPLASGEGRLVVDDQGRAVLVLELDPAPKGRTYETWIIRNARPAPAGLFDGRRGTDIVPVEGAIERGDAVAVTVERKGGVKAPTSTPIVVSAPV